MTGGHSVSTRSGPTISAATEAANAVSRGVLLSTG